MNDKQESTNMISSEVGDIAATLKAIDLLTQQEQFRHWLKTFHHLPDDLSLFKGYKLAIDSTIHLFQRAVEENSTLGLSEDKILQRASFRGISLNKLPNSCEKTILLKNIASKTSVLLKESKDWISLDRNIMKFREDVLSVFSNMVKQSEIQTDSLALNLGDTINDITMFTVYIFLNDTSRGVPLGYRLNVLDGSSFKGLTRSRDYPSKVFNGYKYAIQFLWYQLLGTEFESTSLINMHKSKDWHDFDKYFEVIKSEIIHPLEMRIGIALSYNPLVIFNGSAHSVLRRLLEPLPPNPRLHMKEQLKQLFLWYEIQLVDASEEAFNGVFTFLPLLTGSIAMKHEQKDYDKLRVIKLIHPSQPAGSCDYSYAILIEVGSTHGLADYSGWVLFFDCCYNHGSGLVGYRYIEECIKQYERDIYLTEKEIDKEKFLRLMNEQFVQSSTKDS